MLIIIDIIGNIFLDYGGLKMKFLIKCGKLNIVVFYFNEVLYVIINCVGLKKFSFLCRE